MTAKRMAESPLHSGADKQTGPFSLQLITNRLEKKIRHMAKKNKVLDFQKILLIDF
jgi:hypothetical protein